MGRMPLPHHIVVFLTAALVVGLGLRLYGLGSESLSVDEGITVDTVQAPLGDMLVGFGRWSPLDSADARPSDLNPPLYHLVLHLWTRLFGTSEFSIRLPSVLFGLATIYLTYQIARLLFTSSVGLIAAAMVALSLLQVRYSQEARMYTMMCMLSALSWWSLIKLETGTNRKVLVAGYLVSSALLTYTHVYGLFVVVSQSIYFLCRKTVGDRDFAVSWRLWLGLQATLGILYLPWSFVVLRQIAERQAAGFEARLASPSLNDLAATFVSYASSIGVAVSLLILLLIFGWMQFDSLRTHQNASLPSLAEQGSGWSDPRIYALFAWIFGVTILPFLLSQVMGFYRPRYTISSSIPFYVLLSAMIYDVRSTTLARITVIFLLFFYGWSAYSYYTIHNKPRWREVVQELESSASPGDLVIVNNGEVLHTNLEYYATREDLIKVAFIDDDTRFAGNASQLEQDVDRLIGTHDRVWLVISHRDRYTEPLLAKFQDQWQVLADQKYFNTSYLRGDPRLGIEVLLFGRRNDRHGAGRSGDRRPG